MKSVWKWVLLAILTLPLAAFLAASAGGQEKQPAKGGKVPKDLSLLFLVTLPEAELVATANYKKKDGTDHVKGYHLIIPTKGTNWVLFSDRPNRIAHECPGGIRAFTGLYHKTDLKLDHPNITFAGHHSESDKEQYAVLKMLPPYFLLKHTGAPSKDLGKCAVPLRIIDKSKMPEPGHYTNVSLVVDSLLGDWIEAVAAAVGTAITCSVGEVATVGLGTPACVAAIAGTAGLTGNAVANSAGAP